MAKTRKFCAYRRIDRPYTRTSKYRKKNYIRGNPQRGLAQFEMGNRTKFFPASVSLVSESSIQVRTLALESIRQVVNRRMDKLIGKENYHIKLRVYPHQVLRENPLAAGAGADRMSTGMKHSFGKPIGRAAQIRRGKEIFTISVMEEHVKQAKEAANLGRYKYPMGAKVRVNDPKKAEA